MKILIICGDHFRHRFMLEPILKINCKINCIIMKRESQKSLRHDVPKPLNKTESKLLDLHLKKRYLKEVNAFGNKTIYDFLDKNKIIETDAINLNSTKIKTYIKKFNANICFIMGPGLISEKIRNILPPKTFNIHLGLSPWYRGSATLFWPSYNLEPWKTGITFHKLNSNADSGQIIHHSVAKLKKGMDLFDLTISAMKEGRKDLKKILNYLAKGKKIKSYKQKFYGKSYATKFFKPTHLKVIYELFNDKLIDYYLKNKKKIVMPKLIKLC